MKPLLYQILDEENFVDVPCNAYEVWFKDFEESKQNQIYWKEHSKRCLTSDDLETFFGEADNV